ncbi:MAG: carbohydrate kinase, partial [Chloroflexi bacterium]|nr:carbohydrate kinase [Chloroflexota bacterium]
ADRAPTIIGSAQIAGHVTEAAAALTGLVAGTPVVSGLHDVDACAIGTGCSEPGQLSMTAGTFSINQVISAAPAMDARWACRNFVTPGRWMNMSISPASATNLDWFVSELCAAEIAQAEQVGRSPYAFVNDEIAAVIDEPTKVYFLPFIYGSPYGDQASAGFFGLRGWHTRGHMLRAVFEGVAFNHKWHIDALRSAFDVTEVRVTGGGARSEIWSQIFADAFGLPVVITEAQEAGALGAAICAGLGAGVFASLETAISRTVRAVRTYSPDPARGARLAEAYQLYTDLAQALQPIWARLE